MYPHAALRVGSNLITSVHLALRKSASPRPLVPRASAVPAGKSLAHPMAPAPAARVLRGPPQAKEQAPARIATLPHCEQRTPGVEPEADR